MSSTCTTSPSATPADSRSRLWTRSARPFPHRRTLASISVSTLCIYTLLLIFAPRESNVSPETAPPGELTYSDGPCGLPIMASSASLWQHRDFLLLWLGQSVSRLGDQFTGLAIPVIAVFVLAAGPLQMGVFGFSGTLPFLLFCLLVGGWVDPRQRRSVLIRADICRGLMIATIAALAFVGLLHMAYLYVFSFLIGILTVFFDVAYQAYLPALVERKQLVDANSKLETSNSVANTGGPALAGAVIELFKAPIAMVFDAASFFFSAATLIAIRNREPTPDPAQRRSILTEVGEGLQVVLREPRLRYIAGCTAWSNFFSSAGFSALLIIYLKDQLGFTPLTLGLMFTIGSVGGIVGAVTASRDAKRIGVGGTVILVGVVGGAFSVLWVLFAPVRQIREMPESAA